MSDLSALFQPRSIAVIGASPNPQKLGHVLLKNIVDYEFKGEIFPVNSEGEEVLGLKGYRSISQAGPVDLALISIPNKFVGPVIEECAAHKVRAAIILSSGFGEMGGEGKRYEERIRELCIKSGMRVVGPNCMGIYNLGHKMNATYFWKLPRQEGALSFVSQSGAYGGIFFDEIEKQGLAISKFVSIGNMVDIAHADVVEYLKDDPKTRIIALFIEEIRDGERFMRVVKATDKPIIVLKGGRTEAGGRAAMSHTGSMAGSYDVFSAALKRAGIVLTEGTDDFFDAIKAFLSNDGLLPKGRSLAIMTISGGPSVIASDTAQSIGMEVPQLDAKTRAEIAAMLPPFAALSNPVDMTPQISTANYEKVVDKVLSQDYIGSCVAINCGLDSREFGESFVKASQKYGKPVHAFSIANPQIEGIFKAHNIPIFATPDRCVTAMRRLADYSGFKGKWKTEKAEPSRVLEAYLKDRRQPLELTGRAMLREYGIPVVEEIVFSAEGEALDFARKGYPVVLKIVSDEIAHKTEAGGVRILQDEETLKAAIFEFKQKFGPSCPLLVQRMVKDAVELILGAKRDPVFGPIILVGIGGIYTEVVRDVSLTPCPVDRDMAIEMLKELKGFSILKGYRGRPGVELNTLAELVVKFSRLMEGNPEIKELEINPLMAVGDKAFAVHTLMVV